MDETERRALGVKLADGTLTRDEGYRLMRYCYELTGSWPLETLDESDVCEQFDDRYGVHEKANEWVAEACERVWRKWDSNGELRSSAQEWAMEYVEGYAADDGVTLVERAAAGEG